MSMFASDWDFRLEVGGNQSTPRKPWWPWWVPVKQQDYPLARKVVKYDKFRLYCRKLFEYCIFAAEMLIAYRLNAWSDQLRHIVVKYLVSLFIPWLLLLLDESLIYDRIKSVCAALITHKPRHISTFIAKCLSHEHYIKQAIIMLKLLPAQNSTKRHTLCWGEVRV